MYFIISIDTEEDMPFWKPEEVVKVHNLLNLPRLHDEIIGAGGIPTYLIDNPVISHDSTVNFLQEVIHKNQAEVGLHLHAWNTEPLTNEDKCNKATVLNDLSVEFQNEKIENLHNSFFNKFGFYLTSFRAGRYGLSKYAAKQLARLGYIVDSSVVPAHSFANYNAPDYSRIECKPYKFSFDNDLNLIEISVSADLVTFLPVSFKSFYNKIPHWSKIPSLMHRLNLARKIWLRPTTYTIEEMKQLCRHLLKFSDCPIFNIMFHSSECYPGSSPYNKTSEDVKQFLFKLNSIIVYLKSIGAITITLSKAGRMLCFVQNINFMPLL